MCVSEAMTSGSSLPSPLKPKLWHSMAGDLKDVHDYMIASTEAALATEMVVTIKNKAVEAFNDIMRMQI